MDLSVIIPVYNGEKLLARCLNSVFGQTTRYSFEVICIDDGSTDGSVALIEGRTEKNITLVRQQNAGPATARNRGVELAQGRYCAYLDADDYWKDGFIEQTVSFLDSHEECVAVTVGQMHKTVSGDFHSPRSWMERQEPFVIGSFFQEWAKEQFVGTCATTMRTATTRTMGGQRTDLRVTEDWEFWFALSTYGRWGFIPAVLYVSDGTGLVATREQWVAKMQRRWNNAPTIAEWEQRIVERLQPSLPMGYVQARGIVSRHLAYSQLLSGRTALARQEALCYGDYFVRDIIGRLMVVARRSRLLWWLLCKMLRYREYHR